MDASTPYFFFDDDDALKYSQTHLLLESKKIQFMKTKKETKEQETITIKVKKGSPDEVKLQQQGKPYQVYEKEMKEGQDEDPFNPYGSGETTQAPHQGGPDTNDGFGVDPGTTPGMYPDGLDESQDLEEKKEGKYNPYAVCTSSLGLEGKDRDSYTENQKKKFERCVKDVKKTMKEGKNPVQVILESSLDKLVQKHLTPKMTKGEFVSMLEEGGIIRKALKKGIANKLVGNVGMDKPIGKLYTLTKKEAMEQAPTTAPSKVKPGTTEKPGKSDPFKNPKHQPKPKAGKNMVDDNPKAPITKIPDYITFDQLGLTFENKK
jgi:hypothetical protein